MQDFQPDTFIAIPPFEYMDSHPNRYTKLTGHFKKTGQTANQEKNRGYRDNTNNIVFMNYGDDLNNLTIIEATDWDLIHIPLDITNSIPTWFKNGEYIGTHFKNPDGTDTVLYLHELIKRHHHPKPEFPLNVSIDHINWNKIDNRLVNLRWATQSLQNSNRDKVSRKKNAQELPEELVEHLIPLTNLPKYIQYIEEVYDKRNNTTREFILVAEHPTLKRLGDIKFASSKSRDVSITQKYDQANAILQFINSNPNVTEVELRHQVRLIKDGSYFTTPIDFYDGQDKRLRKNDPVGGISRPTIEYKGRNRFKGYNYKIYCNTSISKRQNYMRILYQLADKYKTDLNFIEYLNTLPKFDADDEETLEPIFVSINIVQTNVQPVIEPIVQTPQQLESINSLPLINNIVTVMSNLFVLPECVKITETGTGINAEKKINKVRYFKTIPFNTNLHPDPNLNLKCNFDVLVKELIKMYGSSTDYFNQYLNMPPIVEPQEFQPIVSPKVISDGSEYNIPKQWTFNPESTKFTYRQWIYDPKLKRFNFYKFVKGSKAITIQYPYKEDVSFNNNYGEALRTLLIKYQYNIDSNPYLKIHIENDMIVPYPETIPIQS